RVPRDGPRVGGREDRRVHARLRRFERVHDAAQRRRAADRRLRTRPGGRRVAAAGHARDPRARAARGAARHDPAVPDVPRDPPRRAEGPPSRDHDGAPRRRVAQRPWLNETASHTARATWSKRITNQIQTTGASKAPASTNASGTRNAQLPIAAATNGVNVSPAPRWAPPSAKCDWSAGCTTASTIMNGTSSSISAASWVKSPARKRGIAAQAPPSTAATPSERWLARQPARTAASRWPA